MRIEKLLELLTFLSGQLLEIDNVYAERLQLADQLLINERLFLLELLRPCEDRVHLLPARHPGLIILDGVL